MAREYTPLFIVGYVSRPWNPIEPSLVKMAKKLATLGLVYYDGEMYCPAIEEKQYV